MYLHILSGIFKKIISQSYIFKFDEYMMSIPNKQIFARF